MVWNDDIITTYDVISARMYDFYRYHLRLVSESKAKNWNR